MLLLITNINYLKYSRQIFVENSCFYRIRHTLIFYYDYYMSKYFIRVVNCTFVLQQLMYVLFVADNNRMIHICIQLPLTKKRVKRKQGEEEENVLDKQPVVEKKYGLLKDNDDDDCLKYHETYVYIT